MLKAGRIPFFVILLALSGCAVRTYSVVKERPDQDLNSGNRGLVAAKNPPAPAPAGRKPTRTTKVIEVELYPILRTNKKPAVKIEPGQPVDAVEPVPAVIPADEPAITEPQKYTVQPGDTLQKIASKFYGRSAKWPRIYEANRKTVKSPDNIKPGQVITIPVE
ncbi:MAG: LysM peptidoglycan-binding domain-containing protein [Candidatus Omnitrophica bacterium]|nr:LysM peptidoglycan-binding domain-containing protein [Candidatus Omnitrophota bacterium]